MVEMLRKSNVRAGMHNTDLGTSIPKPLMHSEGLVHQTSDDTILRRARTFVIADDSIHTLSFLPLL